VFIDELPVTQDRLFSILRNAGAIASRE